MQIVHVLVQVKHDFIEDFIAATLKNACESVREAGVARFDVLQQEDDPSCFLLVEVYRSSEAPAAHKSTEHYARWRDEVATMVAEPRSSVKFSNIFPNDDEW